MQQNNPASFTSLCNLCGNHEITVIGDYSRSGKPLKTVLCNNCGLVWSAELPHNPRSFYENDYRVAYKGTYKPKPKHILRAGKIALGMIGSGLVI